MKKRTYIIFALAIFAIIVTGLIFHHVPKKKIVKETLVVAQKKPASNELYFSGKVEPLSFIPVLSPINGGIIKQFIDFGQSVKKDDPLFLIRSTEQGQNYESAIAGYLKDKAALAKDESDWKNEADLYRQGLVSKNDYIAAKNAYYLDQLSYIQSKETLQKALKYHQKINIASLDISRINQIKALLAQGDSTSDLTIYSPGNGMLLFSDEKKGDASSASIKEDDVLAYVGNLSGISIEIKIDEININQVKKGQSVTVTSPAIPDVLLKGYVSEVNTQAASGDDDSPIFIAKVIVPSLTKDQASLIHVGMNVMVSLSLAEKDMISVPIKSLHVDGDKTFVNVIDKNHKEILRPVIVQNVSLDSAIITQGLQPGDNVVVSH